MKRLAALSLAAACAGCTTLGPMPAMTGMAGAPEPRAGLELNAAQVPGFYLSSATRAAPKGDALGQLGGMFDLGHFVGAPGLAVGGRYVLGADDAGYVEPMLRYRLSLDDEGGISLTSTLFGTHARAFARGASYEATRLGSELGVNVRLVPENRVLELHAFAGASLLGISARGKYCEDAQTHLGVDCPESSNDEPTVQGSFAGVYPAAFLGFGLDGARHLRLPLHGVRLDVMLARGYMPVLRNAHETGGVFYNHAGIGLTVRLGEIDAAASD